MKKKFMFLFKKRNFCAFCSELNLRSTLELNKAKSGRIIKWLLLHADEVISLIESNTLISPLDLLTHARQMTQNIRVSPDDWVLASALHHANISVKIGSEFYDDNPSIICIEMALKNALLITDVTFLYDFDFNMQLYSFVTCAGQSEESIFLATIFTALHWNILVSTFHYFLCTPFACNIDFWFWSMEFRLDSKNKHFIIFRVTRM